MSLRVRVSLGFRDTVRVRVKFRVSFRLSTFIYCVWLPVSVRVRVSLGFRDRVSVLRLLYSLGIRLGLVLGFRDRVRVKVRVSFRIVTFVYTAWGNVTK